MIILFGLEWGLEYWGNEIHPLLLQKIFPVQYGGNLSY